MVVDIPSFSLSQNPPEILVHSIVRLWRDTCCMEQGKIEMHGSHIEQGNIKDGEWKNSVSSES